MEDKTNKESTSKTTRKRVEPASPVTSEEKANATGTGSEAGGAGTTDAGQGGAAGAESGPGGTGSGTHGGTRSKRSVEDTLDDFAERFSKSASDGVKRLEDAFERGFQNLREEADGRHGRIRGFFRSSTGGAVLIMVGVLWFLFAVGLFDNWFFPIILIIVGIYLMQRYKSDG